MGIKDINKRIEELREKVLTEGNKRKFIAIGSIALLLLFLVGGVKAFSKIQINRTISSLSRYAHIKYSDVDLNMITKKIVMKNVELTPVNSPQTTKIDEVTIYDYDIGRKYPHYAHVKLWGIHSDVDPTMMNPQQMMIRQVYSSMGYDDPKVDMMIRYEYDPGSKILSVDNFDMGIREAGEIHMAVKIGNLDMNAENVFEFMAKARDISLNSAEVHYKDRSLISKVIEYGAKERGMDKGQFVSELRENMDREVAKIKDQKLRAMAEEVAKFIKRPNELRLTVNPAIPVVFGSVQMYDRIKLLEMLNLELRSI